MASKIRLVGNWVVVRPAAKEEVTKGWMVIPDTAKEQPQEGVVVAVGSGQPLGRAKQAIACSPPRMAAPSASWMVLRERDGLAIRVKEEVQAWHSTSSLMSRRATL